jgi:hypothetical protein
MIEYRVTKYDPALRDARGAYTADEWIQFKQIGSAFGGVVLTEGEYLRIEQAIPSLPLPFFGRADFIS